MKDCARLSRRLSAYLDGEAGEDTGMIEAHLLKCVSCSAELKNLKKAKGCISSVERKSLPQDYLLNRIRFKISEGVMPAGIDYLEALGAFARKLIPVPLAVMLVSVILLVLVYSPDRQVSSLNDSIFNGTPITEEAAIELIISGKY